jgi:glycine cleavage system H protein
VPLRQRQREDHVEIPTDLHYTANHEWVRFEPDGSATVGITAHAQEQLGELVYVELPALGRRLQPNESCAVVESTKAASDVYSPIAGEVAAVNEALADKPQSVNESPYGEGWLFRVKPASGAARDQLMDAAAYGASLGA